ncbi:beta strand repeat-containing protein [Methylobacter psychrophilus]|uniref:beta strand repeat-containing protein n=1 Tax=Methylobacter psychrophilus TaxID=96941 RepID=UPI0021D50FB3|nr:hypothetical protein [Methylobacter psychrophilus]
MKNNTSPLNKIAGQKETTLRRFMLLAVPALLLTGLSAQAADYNFPGNLPAVCAVVPLPSQNQYTCGVLTLGDDDTISVTQASTITFSGAFTTGKRNLINAAPGDIASDLTLVLNGALAVGANSKLNANVSATAAVNIGPTSVLGGTLTTTLPTGVVTLGSDVEIGGNIKADKGAVTIGAGGKVHGKIIANVGVVTLGANTAIDGNIDGGVGAVTTGPGVMLGGNSYGKITTGAGVVTIGANNKIGNIATGAGAVTVGAGSVVGTVTSPTGVITFGGNIEATSISSGAGAVNVGASSRICGNIDVTGAGVTTLTTGVKVGGNISSGDGAVTVGAGSMIRGNVKVSGAGVVTMTSVTLGGTISSVTGAITATTSNVGGTMAASGAGVVTLTANTANPVLTLSAACAYVPPTTLTTYIPASGPNAGKPIAPSDAPDTIIGTTGNDIITGFRSSDTLTGGLGADQFVYLNAGDGKDTITDFSQGIIVDPLFPLDPSKNTFDLMVKDQIVLTTLLKTLNYLGVDPIADGWVTLSSRDTNNAITVYIKPSGPASGRTNALVIVNPSGTAEEKANFKLTAADFIF